RDAIRTPLSLSLSVVKITRQPEPGVGQAEIQRGDDSLVSRKNFSAASGHQSCVSSSSSSSSATMRLITALLAVCLVAGLGECASINYKSGLRRELCSWGAQYWCSGPKTATLCGKTEWCTSNHWNRHLISEPSCSTVHNLIKHVRKVLASTDDKPTSDYETAKVIAQGCSVIKEEDARVLCKEIVTSREHLLKLIELIDSKLPVQSVAEAVGVCKRQAPEQKLQETEPESCITCEDVVSVTQKHALRHLSLDVYKNMFRTQCDKLGSASKACHDAAMSKYKEFYRRFVGVNPSSVCKVQKQCVSKKGRLSPLKTKSEMCETCKTVVADIRSMDRDANVQAAIRGLVNETCKYLGEFEKLCERMTDEGLEYVFEIIATEMEPEVVCQELQLCSGNGIKTEEKPVPKEIVSPDGVKCVLCEFMMKEVDKMLLSNATEEAILNILDQVCTRLPPTIADQCEALLNQYKPEILKLLSKELDPENVCTFLGVCTKEMQAAPKNEKQSNDQECHICEFVIKVIDDVLMANETETEIEAFLDNLCNKLPTEVRETCDNLVKMYGPTLVKYLVQGLNPVQACTKVGLCQNQIAPKTEEADVGVACAVCEMVMQQLDKLIGDQATAAEVEAGLSRVCSLVPESVRAKCNEFVQEYTPFILQVIAAEIKPKEVCSLLKLCPKTNAMVAENKVVADKQVEDDVCDVCKLAVSALDSLLDANATKEDVTAALEKVCSLLPEALKPQCDAFVSEYAPYVVDIVVSDLKPDNVCVKLGLCSSKKGITEIRPLLKKSNGKVEDELCPVCLMAVAVLENMLPQNATEEVMIDALRKEVCERLPVSMKDQCKSMVAIYLHYVIDLIIQELPPQKICNTIGLCSNTSSSPITALSMAKKLKNKPGPICIECEVLLSELQRDLKTPGFEKTAEAKLFTLCARLPATTGALCRQLVHENLPLVLELLSAYEPDALCALVGLCDKTAPTMVTGPVKAGPQCSICEFVMVELDNILANNATEQQIEQALEQVCNFLPASVKQQCDGFVMQYTPMLIHALTQLKPDQVCTFLRFCSSKVKTKVSPVRGPECIICEYVMNKLDTMLKENATEQEVEQALGQVCNLLPASVKSECDAFVAQYTPQLIQLLLQVKPSQVCGYLGLCSSKLTVKAGPQCVLCEFVMTQLDNILAANATEPQIEQALDTVCNLLPKSVKAQCEDFVHQYTPQLIKILLQYTPDKVCTMLGLCTNNNDRVKASPVNAGPTCIMCEFIMTKLDSILGENATKQEIEQALDQVCNFLPASIKSECDAFVSQYTPKLLQLLLQYKPSQVCTYLGVCPSELSASAGPTCVLCEFVMTQLEKILAANATEQQIEQALDQVCNLLPDSVKQQCDDFVKQYTPTLIKLLLQVTPDKACTFLKLCTTKNTATAGPTCVLCEFVMTQLEKILAANATEQQIEQALDQVCNLLPASVKQQCNDFVKQYTPTLIKLLLQVTPDKACTFLKLCTTKNTGLKAVSPVQGAIECTLCKTVMGILEKMLADNSTEKQIEQALEGVCDTLPEEIRPECHQFMEEYIPRLVGILITYKPEDVCTVLAICSKKAADAVHPPLQKLVERPVKNGPQCEICEFVMSKLDDILASNSTERQIEQALDQVCNFLPSSVKQQCDGFVSQYTPQLIQLLLQVKPQQICTFLNLCTNNTVAGLKPLQAGAMCVVCEAFVKEFENVVGTDVTKGKIEAFLDQACNLVPAELKQQCDQLVATFTPEVLDLLLEIKPNQWCSALLTCQSSLASGSKKLRDSNTCTICEFAMTELDQILGQNATKEQIEEALDKVCSFLPASVKQECDAFVKQYTPDLIQLLLQFKPQDVCTYLGLCSANLAGSKKLRDSNTCTICEFAMTELDQILGQNATKVGPEPVQHMSNDTKMQFELREQDLVVNSIEDEIVVNFFQEQIEEALDKVCSFLPASVKQECDAFVTQYTPDLINLLLKFKPQDVCTYLGLCSANLAGSKKLRDSNTCTICEFAMTELDQILGQNATKVGPEPVQHRSNDTKMQFQLREQDLVVNGIEDVIVYFFQEQIEEALDKVCSFLPASVKQECDAFVTQYTPDLINLLLKFKPQDVCTYLGLCSANLAGSKKLRDSNTCTICEFAMTELDQILGQNATKEQIEEALDKVCSFLPASVKQECDAFVTQYTPDLINLLLQFKPQDVCTYLGLCSAKLSGSQKLGDSTLCEICEFAMTELDQILGENATKEQIEQALDKVCTLLPADVKQICDAFIKQYTPELIQLLQQFKPQEVCTYLGVCSANLAGPKKLQDGPQCTICEFAMMKLDQILADNATEQQIEQALGQVCTLLPANVQQQCNVFVKQYFGELVTILLQYKPQQICTLLRFCSSTQQPALPHEEWKAACVEFVDKYASDIVELLLVLKPEDICINLKLCPNKTAAQTLKVNDGPQCVLCEFVVSQLDKMLSDNATEAQIEAALEQVCNFLPDSIKQDCDTLIKQYTPQLIFLLLQFKPQEVCTKLGMCASKSLGQALRVNESPACIWCAVVMQELDQILSANATESEIEMALEQVCNFLPETIKPECNIFVKQYTPALIQMLLQFEPQEVCTKLGLCKPSHKEQVKDGPLCILCEFVMTELDNILAENSTEAQIEMALEIVCNFMPESIKRECAVLVQQYTPQLVKLLLNFKPQQVCTKLTLCTSTKLNSVADLSDPSAKCYLCEFIMAELDKLITSSSGVAEIEAALKKVCFLLPSNLQENCRYAVEDFTPGILNALLESASPSNVCGLIKACPAATGQSAPDPEGLCMSAGFCNDHSPKGPSKWKKVDTFEYCEVCERLVPQLEELLQQNFTEEAIEAALHEVCKVLDDDKAFQSCEQFVTQYTPVLIKVLLTVSPDRLCGALKLCPPAPEPTVVEQSKSLQFVPESKESLTAVERPIEYRPYCSSCKFLLYYLQTSMVDSFWKDTAKNSMYAFCNQMKYEQDVCKLLMDMNADQVLGLVRGFRFPETFCQSTDMCEPPFDADDESILSKSMMVQATDEASSDYPHCSSCKFLASQLNEVVTQPFWRAQVRTSLDEICNLMTYGSDVCKRVVEENIQFIISNVSTSGWPDHICQAVNLCEVPSKSEQCLTIVRQYGPELLDNMKTEKDPKKVCKIVDLCLEH
ncbi:proactivator polypeptide, partial [Elysia marginata]